MQYSLEDKQKIFIFQVVQDVIEHLVHDRAVERGRAQAKQDISQKVGRIGIQGLGGIIGRGPASVGVVLLDAVHECKQKGRREGTTTTMVHYHLNDKITAEIKRAADLLSRMYEMFIDNLQDQSVPVFANCVADRMVNHMQKNTNFYTGLESWTWEELLLGAFQGRSGKFKDGFSNTRVYFEDDEKKFFNLLPDDQIKSVEGLLQYGTFATQENENSVVCYYVHTNRVKHPFKYHIAVLPWGLVQRLGLPGYKALSEQRITPRLQNTVKRLINVVTSLSAPADPMVESEVSSVDEYEVTPVANIQGSMTNRVANQGQGYVREKVLGDGDCGYTAFGVERDNAIPLLLDHVSEISHLIQIPVRHALLTGEFYQYLFDKEIITIGQEALWGNQELLAQYSNDLAVQKAYINYDVRDKRIDAGYSHPAVLQALAHIQHIELHIWRLGNDNVLVPHVVHEENYATYMPTQVTQRIDLLFVNGNHFDRLKLQGYEHTIPNEGIYPLNSSWSLTTFPLGQESEYVAWVNDWLVTLLNHDRAISEENLRQLFTDLALASVQPRAAIRIDKIQASDEVLKVFKSFLHQIPNFPLKFTHDFDGCVWNNKILRDYFLAEHLVMTYLSSKERAPWQVPPLWGTLSFPKNDVFNTFLSFFCEKNPTMFADLFRDWQQAANIKPQIQANIALTVKSHAPDCGCEFCDKKRKWELVKSEEENNLRARKNASDVANSDQQGNIREMKLINQEYVPQGMHPGFSPEQPRYAVNTVLTPVSWHWPEAYLTQLYWDQLIASCQHDSDQSPLLALMPASIGRQYGLFREAQTFEAVLNEQLLEEEQAYINMKLAYLSFAQSSDVCEIGLIATYNEAVTVLQWHKERLQEQAIYERMKLSDAQRSAVSNDRFRHDLGEMLLAESHQLEKHFVVYEPEFLLALSAPKNDFMSMDSVSGKYGLDVEDSFRRSHEVKQSRGHLVRYYKFAHKAYCTAYNSVQKYEQEYASLCAGIKPQTRWAGTGLSRDEIMIFVQACLKALQIRFDVINHFLAGTSLLIYPEENVRLGSYQADMIRRSRNVVTPGSTLSSEDAFAGDFPPLPMSSTFKAARTDYELVLRAGCDYDATFWAEAEGRYREFICRSKSHLNSLPAKFTFAKYKSELEERLKQLPSLRDYFNNQSKDKSKKTYQEQFNLWRKEMNQHLERVTKELERIAECSKQRELQQTFHAESYQFRLDILLNELLPKNEATTLAIESEAATKPAADFVLQASDSIIPEASHADVTDAASLSPHAVEDVQATHGTALKQQPENYGLVIQEVKQDGNSFFSALAHQIHPDAFNKETGEADCHLDLRREAVRELQGHSSYYLTLIDGDTEAEKLAYLASLERDEAAVGEEVAHAMARALNVTMVILYSQADRPLRIFKPRVENTQIIVLGCINTNHYFSVEIVNREEFSDLERLVIAHPALAAYTEYRVEPGIAPVAEKPAVLRTETIKKNMKLALAASKLYEVAQELVWYFEIERKQLFMRYAITWLVDDFKRHFDSCFKQQPKEVVELVLQNLAAGQFKAAGSKLGVSAQISSWYRPACERLFCRFDDTHHLWSEWPHQERNSFVEESLHADGVTAVSWGRFFTAMSTRWYPLLTQTVMQLLHQGLHPDATYQDQSLVDHVVASLPLVSELPAEQRPDALKKRANHLYYLLDSGALPHWQNLLNGPLLQGYQLVKNISEEQAEWVHIALVVMLFETFNNEPNTREAFATDIKDFEAELNKYHEIFMTEETSWLNFFFGTWYRSSKIRENRHENVEQLKGLSRYLPVYLSHYYAYLGLVDTLIKNREKQVPVWRDGSRLKVLMDKFSKKLNLHLKKVGAWQNLPPDHWRQVLESESQSKRLSIVDTGSGRQVIPTHTATATVPARPLNERELALSKKLDRAQEKNKGLEDKNKELEDGKKRVEDEYAAYRAKKEAEDKVRDKQVLDLSAQVAELKRQNVQQEGRSDVSNTFYTAPAASLGVFQPEPAARSRSLHACVIS